MLVKIGSDFQYFCDVCGEQTDNLAELEIRIDYGCEDSCYGCHEGEHELMKELSGKENYDLQSTVRDYLAQDRIIQCSQCRDEGVGDFITIFELAFRKRRVEIVRKLANDKKLPEFLDDKDIMKERREHWMKVKNEILAEIKKGLSDFGYCSKAHELVQAEKKIEKYQG